jgi:hypothetical protein
MCRVLNKHEAGVPPRAVYIGRGSKRGNPFRIGPDGDRATVIAKHESWLRDRHHLLRALDDLRGSDLVCFCAPLACHGDLLLWLAGASRDERIAWWRGLIALDGVRARDAIRHSWGLSEAEDGRDGFEPVGVERAPFGSIRSSSPEVPRCPVSPAPRWRQRQSPPLRPILTRPPPSPKPRVCF